MAKKKTIEDARAAATKRAGKCLSQKYYNNSTKMLWQCEDGHTWKACYKSVARGSWCPYCAGLVQKSIIECIKLAEKMGGKCLSNTYINSRTRLKWECDRGHVWMAFFRDVNSGHWCMKCSGRAKHSIHECILLADQNGGECVSKKYKNAHTKLQWRCSVGHSWWANYNNISNGSWCPQCKNKSQTLLFNIINDIFPQYSVYSNYREFSWLETIGGKRQEIDIFVAGIGLAIEYDGIQHFEPVGFFGGEARFKEVQRLDAIKNEKIDRHQDDVKYFVRFRYDEPITKKYVISKLVKKGIISV